MQPPPLPPPRPSKQSGNWAARNWKWLVPLLCLIVIGGMGGFFALISGLLKSSDAYKGAVALAEKEPAVIETLGSPITEGFFTTGSINVGGPSGQAALAIPIKGPKGSATVYVEATKSLGKWNFNFLVVEIDATHRRIDLAKQ